MPDLDAIQDLVRARLDELEILIESLTAEAEELRKITATFSASAREPGTPPAAGARSPRPAARKAPATKSRPASASGARRGRPLGSGNRAQQAIANITAQPGITAAEIAKAIGISVNYLYRVLPRLQREGKILKRGQGYHLAPPPSPPQALDT
ncbi:MAG: winged helix-turn-helix transcriptional regulator [Actinobacteria bacterium]|nr:winged helix-turn-helix transcriptional regulator [Actinomycetota bacterium]